MIVTMISVRGRRPAGGIMAVWEFAGGLARRGHEVHVLHTSQLGDRVESLDDVGWFDFDDRVHHHFCDPHAFREPSDFIFVVVGPPPSHLGLPLMWVQALDAFPVFAEKSIFEAPCPKLCTSSFLRDAALAKGVRPEQALHLPYGIVHDKYRITRPIDDRPPRVAMLYNSMPLKDSPMGVEAIVLAKQQAPELEAVVFGVGDVPELPSWVEYVHDPDQAHLVDAIYNGSRMFVLPSLIEGFGLAAVEAMASGCALVATDCGGADDYAIHGETALVSPPQDPAAMAGNLVRLLHDDDARRSLAVQGAEYVQRFDWEHSAALLEDLLREYAAEPDALRRPEELLPWADDGVVWLG